VAHQAQLPCKREHRGLHLAVFERHSEQQPSWRARHGRGARYLLIEGKIAEDGSAKLSATGIVASRQYARGVLAHKGEEYGYNVKAKFQDTEGTGTRDTGLGIVGRPCTFDFTKQQATQQ